MKRRGAGIQEGLKLLGNYDERGIQLKFSKTFLITFSRNQKFKYSNYTFAFLKPTKKLQENFNLSKEVLLLIHNYNTYDTRALDFVDKLLAEYDNRLDKICIILVSKDSRVENKIKKFISIYK